VFFGIPDDGKSPEKFCEFCSIYLVWNAWTSSTVFLYCIHTRALERIQENTMNSGNSL
jgi:hypothetical protein